MTGSGEWIGQVAGPTGDGGGGSHMAQQEFRMILPMRDVPWRSSIVASAHPGAGGLERSDFPCSFDVSTLDDGRDEHVG
nr:hypothetical protein [Mesorhizobium sp.]